MERISNKIRPRQATASVGITLLVLGILFYGCTSRESPQLHSLTIAAAADLHYALDETIKTFKASNPDVDIKTVYGSSGNFYTQISNAAPFDLFMSADMEYPRKLIQEGFAIEGTEFEYAVGRLVLWTLKSSPIDVERAGMDAITDPRVKKFSIANPQHAPYGRNAVAAMQKFGVYEKITDRLVFGENVSQALEFIQAGAADAGIVAMSLATAPPVKVQGKYFEIPLDSYPRMNQGGVILKQVRERDAANRFCQFVLSPQGTTIFKQFGFYMPEEKQQ